MGELKELCHYLLCDNSVDYLSFIKKLKFTIEPDENNKFNLIDLLSIKENTHINACRHAKDIHSGRY